MIEPLGLSPWLRQLRSRVPVKTDVSPGEHPLTRQELNYVLRILDNPSVNYFELLSRLQVFLPNRNKIDHGHPFTKAAILSLGGLDRFLLTVLPFLKTYAGEAVIVGRKAQTDARA